MSWETGSNWLSGTNGAAGKPGTTDAALIFPGLAFTFNGVRPLVTVGGVTPLTITANQSESIDDLIVSGFTDTVDANGNPATPVTSPNPVLNLNFGTNTLTLSDTDENAAEITGGANVTFTGNITAPSSNLVVGLAQSKVVSNNATIGPTGNGTLTLNTGTVNLDSATATTFAVGQGSSQNTSVTPLGIVNQNAGSIVTTGANLTIGIDGGIGEYTLSGGAQLNIGGQTAIGVTNPTAPAYTAGPYTVEIGTTSAGTAAVAGAFGSLTISGNGTELTALNTGTVIVVGGGSIGGTGSNDTFGSITQNTTDPTTHASVRIGGNSLLFGDANGSLGTYDLQAGTLSLSNTITELGAAVGGTGQFTQEGGSLLTSATSQFVVGDNGSGFLTIGSATQPNGAINDDFKDGLTIAVGDIGVVTQNAGTVTVENAPVNIGVGSVQTGEYDLEGGKASFQDGAEVGSNSFLVVGGGALDLGTGANNLIVDADGEVFQSGGTVTIAANQQLSLAAAGSSYTLSGGTLSIATRAGDDQFGSTTPAGNLNFAGGTLLVTGTGAFTDPMSGFVDGTNTISAPDGANVALTGTLNGGGGFIFSGSPGATFQFSSTTTNTSYTGSTEVAGGTLIATDPQLTSSSKITVDTGAILDLSVVTPSLTYNNPVAGGGTLRVSFAAGATALNLGDTSGYSGEVDLGVNGRAGTLTVGNGSFSTITGSGSNVTIGGSAGSGTVTYLNNVSYSGLTTIDSGYTLQALNTAGAVNNMGTLALNPSSTVGSNFTINGDLTSNNTLVIRTQGTQATTDTYSATTANLTGKIFLTGAPSATQQPPIQIVVTSGGLTTGPLNSSAPGGLQIVSSFLVTGTLALDANPDILDVNIAFNPLVGQTPNQQAIANGFNSNPANKAYQIIASNPNLTSSDVPAILDQLGPQSLQYARNIAFENTTFMAQRVNGFCSDQRAGYGGLDTNAISIVSPGFQTGLGRSLNSLLADNNFHSDAPNGVNYYSDSDETSSLLSRPRSTKPGLSSTPPGSPWDSSQDVISDSPNPYLANQNPAGPEAPKINEFISGDVVLADLNKDLSVSNAPSSKANYTAADATAGVSFRMTSNLAAGVLFNYNHTDAHTDSAGSKTTIDSYSPGLFATFFEHGFYINGLFSFGYNQYDNERNVSALNEVAKSSPNGQQYVGDLDFGYDFHPDKNWVAGPILGVTYTHLDIDSFTETGAPADDLSVNSQSVDSLRTRLGGHVIFQTNIADVLIQPNFTALWQHECLDNGSGITSSVADAGTFTIQTAAPDRDSALIGLGCTATLNTSLVLYLNYYIDAGASSYLAQSVVGGFKTRF